MEHVNLLPNFIIVDLLCLVLCTSLKGGLVWAAWTMVGGLVQGWDLGAHAVLQHSSGVVFTAAKTFLGNVHVSGTITSGSRADHCPYFPIRNFTIHGKMSVGILGILLAIWSIVSIA